MRLFNKESIQQQLENLKTKLPNLNDFKSQRQPKENNKELRTSKYDLNKDIKDP